MVKYINYNDVPIKLLKTILTITEIRETNPIQRDNLFIVVQVYDELVISILIATLDWIHTLSYTNTTTSILRIKELESYVVRYLLERSYN